MIWKRTLSCQMTPAKYDTTSVDLAAGRADTLFRATGQILVFPGFMAVYLEDADDVEQEQEARLPLLEEQESVPVDRDIRRAAFHATTAALHGSKSGQDAGGIRHRQALDLREHNINAPGSRLCVARQEAIHADGHRPVGKRFPDIALSTTTWTTASPRAWKKNLTKSSNGEREWVPVLKEFWKDFARTLKSKEKVARGSPDGRGLPQVRETVVSAEQQAWIIRRLQRLSGLRLHTTMGRSAGRSDRTWQGFR